MATHSLPALFLLFSLTTAELALASQGSELPGGLHQPIRYQLDFDNVAISDVVRHLAQWTGKLIVLPPDIKGRITIVSPTPVTAGEAWNAFLAALQTNGLWLDHAGDTYRVRALADGPAPLASGSRPLSEAMITRVLPLRFTGADEMKNALKQVLGPRGLIVASPPDALVVSDSELEVGRIESLVRALDRPGTRMELHIVQVSHRAAQELASTLQQVFPGGATRIVADPRTNRLIVVADAASFTKVARLIAQLDVE